MKKHNFNILQRFFADEQGQFTLIAALTIGTMIIATGASLDIHQIHAKNQEAQNLLDSASLAAALALNSEQTAGNSETPYYKTVGEDFFKRDNRFDLTEIKSLQFELSDDGTEITGSVSLDYSLLFGGVLGGTHKSISATSVVSVTVPPEAGNGCIIILEENSQGLLLNSGATIEAPDCEVAVHATGNPALISNNNVTLDVKKLCVAGNQIINNGGSLSNLETNCEAMSNPFNGAFPEPDLSCDFNNGNYNNSTITLNPGVYCGWHNFNNGNAQVTFNPGTYVIRNGGWNVNGGDWEAEGVSFYFADQSRIQFNSGVSANVTAPTSGDYRGVAILEREGLGHSDFILNDSKGFDVSGLIYLPSRNVTFNSGGDLTVRDMSFIVNRLTVNNGDLVLDNTTILSEVGGASGGSVVAPYLAQ